MSINLVVLLIIMSLSIFILTTYFLIKGRIPEKYALLWYMFSIFIIISGLFPKLISSISKLLGFELMSNMILVLLIGILFLLVMSLTIMMAGQKKKTTLLIQEISLLKSEVNNDNK
mgnify:CR=1 FL=1